MTDSSLKGTTIIAPLSIRSSSLTTSRRNSSSSITTKDCETRHPRTSLKRLARHVEVSSVLDEQNRFNPLGDTFSRYDFIVHDAATEVLFDSTVDRMHDAEGTTELDEELCQKECQCAVYASRKQIAQTQKEKKLSVKRDDVTKPHERGIV